MVFIIKDNIKIEELTKQVKDFIKKMDIDVVGIANAVNEIFLNAPEENQPKNVLKNTKSVVVFGKSLPRAVFQLNHHKPQIIHRLYHSTFKHLDICSARLSSYLESLGYYAIPIPSYLPLTIRNLEPWGLISLKHAGKAAGLGQIAKNGLLINPKYGTLLRLSAILTTAELIPDPMLMEEICVDCNLCIDNCPNKAFTKSGKFKKLACLPNSVKHALSILHPFTKDTIEHVEIITNTMFLEYALGCTNCIEICPLNNTPLK